MAFNWLYTSWNDNEYILFLIIVILFFIIIDFKLLTRKKSTFSDISTTIPSTTIPSTTRPSTTIPSTTIPSTTRPSTTIPSTTIPSTTIYQAPTASNPGNNLYISNEEKAKWRKSWVQLDGNEETLADSSKTFIKNDILHMDSTMYSSNTSANSVKPVNYQEQANWATIDNLGKSLTDTLGGINSNLGYTILEEQLGTFKPDYNNPNVYDNTQNYKSGMNPNTVDGASLYGAGSGYQQVGKSPIFMQKDFAGVANIFAPNIYVSNAPLKDDGIPDMSFSTGDGNFYSA